MMKHIAMWQPLQAGHGILETGKPQTCKTRKTPMWIRVILMFH